MEKWDLQSGSDLTCTANNELSGVCFVISIMFILLYCVPIWLDQCLELECLTFFRVVLSTDNEMSLIIGGGGDISFFLIWDLRGT